MSAASRPDPPRRWQRLLIEPRRPAVIRQWPGAHWLVVATVSIGAFLGQLDASIVTLALPTLQQEFDASLAAVEWVALSYLLVLVATVTAVGRMADMLGRKLLYTYGFAVFTLASIGCGLAPSLGVLIGFRVVQAVGAAMLQANSVALIATAVARSSLGRAIGIQGAAQAVGLALGPTIGGLLISLAGWRWIFFVNVPVGLLGLVLAALLLPRSRHLAPRVRFDWAGFWSFGPAVVLFLLALNLAGSADHSSPVLLLAMFGGTAVLLALFLSIERRSAAPMIDLRLFARATFSTAITAGLLSYLILFAVLFLVPFFLEHVQHVTPVHAGAVLSVLPVALGVTAPFAGRCRDRLGARVPTVLGMLLTAGSLVALTLAADDPRALPVTLAGIGVGLGAFTPANNAAIMASAPIQQSGMAGGVLNLTRGLGTSLGVAIVGLILGLQGVEHPGASAASLTTGFQLCTAVLAGLALVAAALAWRRDPPPSTTHAPPTTTVEPAA